MIFLLFSLLVFFITPFLWLAIAFWSKIILFVGLGFTLLGLIWFFTQASKAFLRQYQASPLDPASAFARALARAEKQLEKEKLNFVYWIYPSTVPHTHLWCHGNQRLVLFSQGMVCTADEVQLAQILQHLIQCEYYPVFLQNRIYALTLWWDSLKGRPESFRYWFLSFWFYPLEHLLKIAKF